MMIRTVRPLVTLTLLGALGAATLAACAERGPVSPEEQLDATGAGKSGTTGNGTGADTSKGTTTPPATGPVVAVTISPAELTTEVGRWVVPNVIARNAAGQPVYGNRVTWSSSDAKVVAVAADTLPRAVAPGTATLTATVGGVSASTRVTVVPATSRPDTGTAKPPAMIAKFTLKGTVYGLRPRTATDSLPRERLGGVTVRLVRQAAGRDSASQPRREVVATTTASASGEFSFGEVPGAFYEVEVVAPAGGAWKDGARGLGIVTVPALDVAIVLARRE
jgi:hypothetical protein